MLRRRQLPAWSPFRISYLPGAARDALIASGDPRAALGADLLSKYGAAGVALTASATHALTLALRHAAQRRPGAAILLPAYTCFEVATAAVAAGAPVILYDLDPDTLGPDWESIQAAAQGSAIAALVISPLFGVPVDWDHARRAASAAAAPLVADVAQAHGASGRGRPAGAAGDWIVLSFGRGKGWTGFGGGALLWAAGADPTSDGDRGIVTRSGMLESGRGADLTTIVKAGVQWALGRPALFGLPAAIPALEIGKTIYHPPTPVRGMSRVSAALVLRNAELAASEVEVRRGNARAYAQGLPPHSLPGWTESAIGVDSGALRFPITVEGGWGTLEHGPAPWYGAGPGYPTPLHRIPALRALLTAGQPASPVAERLAATLVTLPTHSGTTESDRAGLIDVVRALAPSHSSHAPVM